ncbi:hypothetical protein, partial [Phaeodactylibacter xiamenensis]|uniref:hypothetical protein n=1 Tax=Phaeodactylibacter xiamenensis TaxID=1524460 RepID=UPI0024A8CCE2
LLRRRPQWADREAGHPKGRPAFLVLFYASTLLPSREITLDCYHEAEKLCDFARMTFRSSAVKGQWG